MTNLVQHVFKCKKCMDSRPCIFICIEHEKHDVSDVKTEVETMQMSNCHPNFVHCYSIPYEGDI